MDKIQSSKIRSVPTLQFLKRSLTFKGFKEQFKDAQLLWVPYKTGLQLPCAFLQYFHFSFACFWHAAMPGKRGRRASKLACLFLQIYSNKINFPLEIEIYQKLWLLTPPKQKENQKGWLSLFANVQKNKLWFNEVICRPKQFCVLMETRSESSLFFHFQFINSLVTQYLKLISPEMP